MSLLHCCEFYAVRGGMLAKSVVIIVALDCVMGLAYLIGPRLEGTMLLVVRLVVGDAEALGEWVP
jgi:hypothetical protein